MFIYLLTNICNDMHLDIVGEAVHGHMDVGGLMCHHILAQISSPALSGITEYKLFFWYVSMPKYINSHAHCVTLSFHDVSPRDVSVLV